jgi:hypothetical protein
MCVFSVAVVVVGILNHLAYTGCLKHLPIKRDRVISPQPQSTGEYLIAEVRIVSAGAPADGLAKGTYWKAITERGLLAVYSAAISSEYPLKGIHFVLLLGELPLGVILDCIDVGFQVFTRAYGEHTATSVELGETLAFFAR